MTTAFPGLPHLLDLIRSPRGGLAILAALLLSTALVIQAGAATLQVTPALVLPDGAQSTAYSQTLTATGGTAPYTWDITEGALPAGLTLTGALISGSPSVLANSAFTVRVTDGDGNTATKSLAIKVNPQLAVATTALASGVVSVPYTSQTLAATGGSAPYTWAVTTGALPAGLVLTGGVISGTPTATAPAFTVTVTDAAAHTATKSLTITVSGAGVLTVVTSALPNGIQNLAGYSTTLTAAGGTPPYTTWAVIGSLPAGLTLNTSTGVISGTPTGTGTSTFTVTVTDSAPATTAPKTLSITVNAALTITSTDPLPGAIQGTAYANVLAATGGTAPYTWTISAGALPTPLTLFNAAGVISGVPTTAGPNAFTVQVTDANGVTTTKALSIAVAAAVAPTITTTTLPSAIIGSSYTYQLQRTGGVSPFTWATTVGTLPTGLALDAATGIISGTPLVGAVSAPTLTFQVSSTAGTSVAKLLPITVVGAGAPVITTTTLPNATIGVAYPSQQLLLTGGTGPTFTWALAPGSGPLPTGLTLSAAGAITGTPTVLGPVTFTVRVTDSAAPTPQFDDQVLSVTVVAAGAVTITTTTIPNGTINIAYSQTLARTGGTGPFTWSVVVAPPAWLTLNATTGQLTGTPTAIAAAASFTVRVTDTATTLTDDQVLSITVGATPPATSGNGNYYGPCKAFYKSASAEANSNASAFKRLLDAAGVTAQVQAFCDVNGQPESQEDQEFRRLCTSFFSGSNGWRSGGSKVSGLRRLIEAAGSADALRSFCTTRFGAFTGQECDDDDLHGTMRISNSSRDNDNGNGNGKGNKKGKH